MDNQRIKEIGNILISLVFGVGAFALILIKSDNQAVMTIASMVLTAIVVFWFQGKMHDAEATNANKTIELVSKLPSSEQLTSATK